MTHIAWASGTAFAPHDADLPLLEAAADRAGWTSEVVAWDDAGVDWSAFDLVVVRSCWDYVPRRAEFLAWAERVPRLANSADTIAWNTDKTYLAELEAAGIAIVPTAWNVTASDELPRPRRASDPWPAPSAWVVKPTISAGSSDTARWTTEADALDHSRRLLDAGRPTMTQPYLEAVDHDGETGLLFYGGRFSHAFRKGALLAADAAPREAPEVEEDISPRAPTTQQISFAESVLVAATACLGEQPLYARVDLVDGPDGEPRLLELELAEPSFFLDHAVPEAADDVIAAIAGHLG